MPLQLPQWTDYLTCPVCRREFGSAPRCPISLGCGHTICKHCLANLHTKQCPYDQTKINSDLDDLPVNTALLQLVEESSSKQTPLLPLVKALPEEDRLFYNNCTQCIEELARYLKYTGNGCIGRLSRPMQKKLVTLVQCAVLEEEGRGRAYRTARSLGERIVVELILYHQNPQQLTANLWAAIRARGCQFLGPAMQEEVLKLVLLALEDGSALSRKVLVMFIVQRLEPHFPQASKTSIGHVVQLLYRASCFKVSKRECESSLMQLKEEFRSYDALRREHDAQLVQMASEAGVRIAPDQWSALLYGDAAHKSHMQSIIDKLQTPQSFAQSVRELVIALQRTGDPANLLTGLRPHLDLLATIDPNPDATPPTLQNLACALEAARAVVVGFSQFMWQQTNSNHPHQGHVNKSGPAKAQPVVQSSTDNQAASHSPQLKGWVRATSAPPTDAVSMAPVPNILTAPPPITPAHKLYKVLMCRDTLKYGACPRGGSCTYAHSEAELDIYRNKRSSVVPQLMKQANNAQGRSGDSVFGTSPIRMQDCGTGNTIEPISTIQNNVMSYNTAGVSMAKQYPASKQPAANVHGSPLNFNHELNFNDLTNGLSGNMSSQCSISAYPSGTSAVYPQSKFGDINATSMSNSNGFPGVCHHAKENIFINSMNQLSGLEDVFGTGNISEINLASLYDKRNNIIDQLNTTSSLQDVTELKNFSINQVSALQNTSFVRSDSILADDEFVPYDEPSVSKFGPISRLNRERPNSFQSYSNVSNFWNKPASVDNAFNGNFCTPESSAQKSEEMNEHSGAQNKNEHCFICRSLLDVCEAQSSSQDSEFSKKNLCVGHTQADRDNQNDPKIFCLSCSQNGDCNCQKQIYSNRQPIAQYMRDVYNRKDNNVKDLCSNLQIKKS